MPGASPGVDDDDGDVVPASAVQRELYQRVSRLLRIGVLEQGGLDAVVIDLTGEAVAAQHEPVAVQRRQQPVVRLQDLGLPTARVITCRCGCRLAPSASSTPRSSSSCTTEWSTLTCSSRPSESR